MCLESTPRLLVRFGQPSTPLYRSVRCAAEPEVVSSGGGRELLSSTEPVTADHITSITHAIQGTDASDGGVVAAVTSEHYGMPRLPCPHSVYHLPSLRETLHPAPRCLYLSTRLAHVGHG